MQLSIIIINYNVKYFLEQCLCSVLHATKQIEAEIIVVDNNSPDDSIFYLRNKFPQVKFIENDTNVGFAKANNQALKMCKGEYILYLNPDTLLPEDVLINCLYFFKTNIHAGAAGVKMVDGNGEFLPESKRSFPSPIASFYKLAGLAKLFPASKIFNRYALGYLHEDEVHEVDVLSGAFMMTRKSIAENLNGFDEDFFMYGEDIDFSYRIKHAGYKNYYLGTNAIIHFKGESTKKSSINYVHHFYNAMTIFVSKHYNNKKRLSKELLQVAIKSAALLSTLSMPVKKGKNLLAKPSNKRELKILLVGADENVTTAGEILSKNNLTYKTAAPQTIDRFNSFKADELIFCTGFLTYKTTIQYVQKYKGKYFFKWHGSGTQSISGSHSKNITGDIYI